MKRVILAWTLLFLCNTMWALQFTSVKLIQDQVGPYFGVFGPMLFATILLIPFVYKDFRNGLKLSWRDVLMFAQLALLGAFPAQVLMTWGAQYSLASNAAILTLTLPVITAVFAFLLLKEKMTRVRWLSFIIAIIGVILCSTGDVKQMDFDSKYAVGNILIFLSIIGSAYYNVTCKKIGERFTEAQLLFYSNISLLILIFPLVLIFEGDVFQKIPEFTSQTWIGLSLLGVFHNFLSMILFFMALKMLEATQVALSNYLITFMGLPIAAIWLGEKLNSGAIIGGILVLTSTLIITVVDYRVNKRNELAKTPRMKLVS
jgi:drug/metabolite transporter (DMT)-like permease